MVSILKNRSMKTHKKLDQLNVLIYDEDLKSAAHTKHLLQKAGAQSSLAISSLEALDQQLEHELLHVCLLNIPSQQHPQYTADVCEQIRQAEALIPIIFSAEAVSKELYQEMERQHPSSFLKKGYTLLELQQALELAALQLENEELRENQGAQFAGSPTDRVFFRVGDSIRGVDPSDISYFFAKNKFTFARFGERQYATAVQIKVLAQSLRPLFVRCHRKFLVNVNHIDYILPKEDKVKVGNELLPIGHTYRKQFLAQIHFLR